MTVHSFKDGDRVRLTVEYRSFFSDLLATDDTVPLHLFGEGTVIDRPGLSLDEVDPFTRLVFTLDGVDILVNWDTDPDNTDGTNPSTASSTGLEFVSE